MELKSKAKKKWVCAHDTLRDFLWNLSTLTAQNLQISDDFQQLVLIRPDCKWGKNLCKSHVVYSSLDYAKLYYDLIFDRNCKTFA